MKCSGNYGADAVLYTLASGVTDGVGGLARSWRGTPRTSACMFDHKFLVHVRNFVMRWLSDVGGDATVETAAAIAANPKWVGGKDKEGVVSGGRCVTIDDERAEKHKQNKGANRRAICAAGYVECGGP